MKKWPILTYFIGIVFFYEEVLFGIVIRSIACVSKADLALYLLFVEPGVRETYQKFEFLN
jgi:hypothetical protein